MKNPYILVLFYSRSGHTQRLAEFIAQGIESLGCVEARLRTVPPVAVQTDTTLPPVPLDGAPYATLDDLKDCIGLALGSPTRFGNMAAPMKHFIDGTSGLWNSGALIGKPASVFTSTGSLHGGQETTLLTMILPLMHHGMIWVGSPYSNPELMRTSSGGTPYGVSHLAGVKSDRSIDDTEKQLAFAAGQHLARIALKLQET
ncbi:NAD(P)H:quinone oxidoreductase [Hydromonas duriensis]|nr:NAD(P)H:quinone oxidoreductase [Hydromonas duriensis]